MTDPLPSYPVRSLRDPDAAAWRDDPRVRVLHFLRHGEALHQERNADARARGEHCRCFDPSPPPACPYWSEDLVDAPLTPRGRDQVRGVATDLDVGRVLSSPMRRTLESAQLAFPEGTPIEALPALRPRVGAHRHSRRSPRSQLAALFPRVDLSRVVHEEDHAWSDQSEPRARLEARAAAFLAEALAPGPRVVAVVTHFTLLLALLLAPDDPWMLGPSARPAGAPALLDARGCQDPTSLRVPTPVGEVLTLLVRPHQSPTT